MAKKTKKNDKITDFRIGFIVHDVSRVRRTLFDNEMKPYGITRSQWWALAQLSRTLKKSKEEGILQTDLASILNVGKVTVGGLIDRLEANGYVERRPDAKDRRAKRVVVTDRGHAVLEMMMSIGRKLNEKIFAGIEPENVRIAEEVLSKMKTNILNELGSGSGQGAVRDEESEIADI